MAVRLSTITWTNDDLLSIELIAANVREISIENKIIFIQ